MDGKRYNYGFLTDYAFFTYALLTLYDVIKDDVYLEIAKKLINRMLELFGEKGALYYNSDISEQLIIRPRDIYDGAIPSGNSFALLALGKLYTITKDNRYYDKAFEIINSYGGNINRDPTAYVYSLLFLIDFM